MDIGPVRNSSPDQAAHRVSPEPKTATSPTPNEPPKDKVEISLEARRKLAELAEKAKAEEALNQGVTANQPDAELTGLDRADSIDAIKQRIEAGYYNRADVISKIADRLSDEFES